MCVYWGRLIQGQNWWQFCAFWEVSLSDMKHNGWSLVDMHKERMFRNIVTADTWAAEQETQLGAEEPH